MSNAPIHVAAVGLSNLRFFRSPLPGPQQPWHSVDDLMKCLVLDRSLRRHFRTKMIREHSSETRTVQTDTGETVIAPHFMAQGFISAMKEIGKASDAFETAYTFGIVGAMNNLTEGMSELDSINFGIAAFRNSNGIPGPHPKVDETAIIRTRRGKGGRA